LRSSLTRWPRALKNFARFTTQRLLLLPDKKHHEPLQLEVAPGPPSQSFRLSSLL
jgi:hypothetical protein